MIAPWISCTDADPDPVCGRGDCDRRAVVLRHWLSDSDRRWLSRACDVHEVERDPASRLPGFRLLSETRVHPPAVSS